MQNPPLRYTLTLDAAESQDLSDLQALLHKEGGKPVSRAEAIRDAVRQRVAVLKAKHGAQ
jgi:hypothetical protein